MYLLTTAERSMRYRARPSSLASTSAASVLPVPLSPQNSVAMPRPRALLPAKPQSWCTLSRWRACTAICCSARRCASGSTRSSQLARASMRCARPGIAAASPRLARCSARDVLLGAVAAGACRDLDDAPRAEPILARRACPAPARAPRPSRRVRPARAAAAPVRPGGRRCSAARRRRRPARGAPATITSPSMRATSRASGVFASPSSS